MFVLFRGYDNDTFSTWIESILGMFRMSLGAFGEIYETFDESIQEPPGYIWFPRVSALYLCNNRISSCSIFIYSAGNKHSRPDLTQRVSLSWLMLTCNILFMKHYIRNNHVSLWHVLSKNLTIYLQNYTFSNERKWSYCLVFLNATHSVTLLPVLQR